MDADIIIIGGGCAGLSLAANLAAPAGAAPSAIVLEPRTEYTNDRTWCGWRGRPHLFSHCISASWSKWTVSSPAGHVTTGHGTHAYDCIRADAFYGAARAAIRRSPGIKLQTGIIAGAVTQNGGHVRVETDRGALHACIAIDTRPDAPVPGAGLLQSFAGLEIEAETACFDPATVGLMEFLPGPADTICFLYTLPFSPTHALLELTWMSATGSAPPGYAMVDELLRARLGCGFHVLRRESGCLPMRPFVPGTSAATRTLRMGIAGGALRPSTGYGFANIQLQSADLAQVLRRGGADAAIGWRPEQLPAWLRWMDRLFLQVLRRHPDRAPYLLTRLFQSCPPGPLVRFLSGTGGLADAARVVCSLPPMPFLREIGAAA